ncbi:hypothetical protein LTR84_007546 [Exophiala bonariae]|uniref:Transcription factor domain-containing protein n=1 Tax=Exophiala bonariae TaxID=1690606 RepID=A0AAV9NPH8_9EURO|nr:hypothetical protein LTR84_007546 [Exophiala bonariae]
MSIPGATEERNFDEPMPDSESIHQTQDQSDCCLVETRQRPDIWEISESKDERMMQLELLHHYHMYICTPFKVAQSPIVEATWQNDVPTIAFENDNLLYAIFTISATFMLRAQPLNTELQIRRDRYLALTLQCQRNAVDELSQRNADAISFTALLIQMNSFAMLHERINPICGHEAITEWLKTGPGLGQIVAITVAMARQNPSSKFKIIMDAPPAYAPNIDYHFRHAIPPQSRPLLDGHLAQLENLTPSSREIYERTLRFLGTIHHSNEEGKPSFYAARQTQGFSLLVPKAFVEFVEEGRSLALVVLAHFFAQVALVKDPPWWMGDAPIKAINAISQTLQGNHDTVLQEMEWPCMVARDMRRGCS